MLMLMRSPSGSSNKLGLAEVEAVRETSERDGENSTFQVALAWPGQQLAYSPGLRRVDLWTCGAVGG